jgi:hypothetical protein
MRDEDQAVEGVAGVERRDERVGRRDDYEKVQRGRREEGGGRREEGGGRREEGGGSDIPSIPSHVQSQSPRS